jgi:penicillin-binding protein 1A
VCLAALVPGLVTLAGSNDFNRDKLANLRGLAQRSTIFDAAGNVMGVLGTQDREDVTLDQVPTIVQDAVISVEDRTFWDNDGVDLNAVVRAALKNATSGEIEQGGSTITQQLIKKRLLTDKRDVNRKVREIVLALRLTEKYSKRQILEQYLNTVYFGQGAYGVKAAAERLFIHPGPTGTPTITQLKDLSPGQAALLAGLISNPEGNNPFSNPEGAKKRRAIALAAMVREAYITQAQADAHNAEPLPTIKPAADLRPRDAWTEEVQDRLFHDPLYNVLGNTLQERQDKVLQGGLKIYSTKDPRMQAAAQNAMNEYLPSKPDFTGSLISIDPATGFVKAMIAGSGFADNQYNIATSPIGRQAGSTWKVITLAAALDSGFSPEDQVDGSSPCDFGIAWGKTQNAGDGSGGGPMALRAATAGSVNCAFARTELAVGFTKVIDTAKKMGITQNTLKPLLTLTLGTIESTATEMATVAATIANGGMHRPPIFISKIVSADGTVVFDGKNVPADRAIPADVAACEANLLRAVVTGGTGTRAQVPGRQVAGKTGTTDNRVDANFLGFTPQLATFVWHGNYKTNNPAAGTAGFGGEIPAMIFRAYMTDALEGQPAEDFPAPGPVCSRPGAFVGPSGRSASAGIDFPTASTEPPTTAVVAPPTTATTGGGGPTTSTSKPVVPTT